MVVFVFAAMLGIIPAAVVGIWGGPLWLMIVAYTVGGAASILSVGAIAMLRPMSDEERALVELGSSSDWNRSCSPSPGSAGIRAPSPRGATSARITHLSTARKNAPGGTSVSKGKTGDADDIYRWPDEVPQDLRLRLLDLLSYDSVGPDDIWDELHDWLIRSKAACPLPVRAPRSSTRA